MAEPGVWWQQHWIELATLVAIAGAWARMEMGVKHLAWRQGVSEKRLDAHAIDIRELRDDYSIVVNKCPMIREAHIREKRGGGTT